MITPAKVDGSLYSLACMQHPRYSSYSIHTRVKFDSIAKGYVHGKSSGDTESSYYGYLHGLKRMQQAYIGFRPQLSHQVNGEAHPNVSITRPFFSAIIFNQGLLGPSRTGDTRQVMSVFLG